jgi:predicted nucleic acid-binding protein
MSDRELRTHQPTSRFSIIALTEEDLDRTAQILDDYSDSNLDFVDATVMAIAERYKIAQVLTLDQRDFRLFRPRHCESFEILP